MNPSQTPKSHPYTRLGKFGEFLEMIKIEHTVFALPFAFIGAMLGAQQHTASWIPEWAALGWILLAMVGARTAAMGLNRVIDRAIDARNPRTASRAIPTGALRVSQVMGYVIGSLALLTLAASQLNPICLPLLPIAIFMLVLYSYTKRFTWLCHVVLGLTIGLAPLGGYVAIAGEWSATAWLLYIANVCWLAGFDIIYACQDVEFDRTNRVYSIPARFGLHHALRVAAFFHVGTGIALAALVYTATLGWIFILGLGIAFTLLIQQHRIVKPDNLSRLQVAFFSMNGTLSVVLFIATVFDLAVN